jgi:hypothetical protein
MLRAARHRRLRRIKIVTVWVVLGILIGAPVALAIISMEGRHRSRRQRR